jgi:hypothetical protein
MKFAILQVSLRESEKKRKTVVVAPTRRKKKMKKFAGIVMALLVVGSLAFATYSNPDNQSVVISTTIDQQAFMAINTASKSSGALDDTNVTSQELAAAGEYGAAFYVNTRSNAVGGFKLNYTMSALTGTGDNTDVIPVTVSTKTVVLASESVSSTAVETSFTSETAASPTAAVIETASTSGMENNSVEVKVKANSATWATDVAADTYTANLTFTFTAN